MSNSQTTQFQFTRHILSCNNINCGSFLGKDWEPSATAYGISTTLQFALQNKDRFAGNKVYVSNLIRTWMTAVLLYGTTITDNTTKEDDDAATSLELYVSPYLKEFNRAGIYRGNYPYDTYRKSLEQFRVFLNILYRYGDKVILNETMQVVHVRFPDAIWIHFKDINSSTPSVNPICKFNKKYTQNSYQYENISYSYRFVDDTFLRSKAFLATGDLEKFMHWYNQDTATQKLCLVHVVTHSRIMKSYLKTTFAIDIANETKYTKINKSNCWSFRTCENRFISKSYNILESLKLKAGVPIDIDHANKTEVANSSLSLCGKYNKNVRGGNSRHTRRVRRKRHKSRTKRRSRRK